MTRIQTINLGPLDDHPINKGTCFNLMGHEVVVFRDSEGKVYALDNGFLGLAGSVSMGTALRGKVWLKYDQSIDLLTGQVNDSSHFIRTFHTWIQEGCIMIEYSYQNDYTKHLNYWNGSVD